MRCVAYSITVSSMYSRWQWQSMSPFLGRKPSGKEVLFSVSPFLGRKPSGKEVLFSVSPFFSECMAPNSISESEVYAILHTPRWRITAKRAVIRLSEILPKGSGSLENKPLVERKYVKVVLFRLLLKEWIHSF